MTAAGVATARKTAEDMATDDTANEMDVGNKGDDICPYFLIMSNEIVVSDSATKSRNFKTAGMSDLDVTLDHDYIRQMPLNKPVPVSHKEGSVIDTKSFVASLLVM
jgi:hypothetical protein